MNLALSQNIRCFRKERHLTQEQLAEAMGVTSGAVYKWESGQSTPELRLLVELADFFSVSTDVLIGYQMQCSSAEQILQQLRDCRQNREYEEGIQTVRKALHKYPNHFEINYMCALLLTQIAEDRHCAADYEAALRQLERACALIGQNTDASVSELSIRNKMAQIHFQLGHTEICLEMLKKYNSCGINHAQIGCILADSYHRTEEAADYLRSAFAKIITDLDNVVLGFTTVLFQSKEYETMISSLEWLRTVLQGGAAKDTVTWFQKYECVLLAIEAEIFCIMGNDPKAKAKLTEAAALARRFDAENECNISMPSLLQVLGAEENHYNAYGKTAFAAAEHRVMTDAQVVPQLPVLWAQVKQEAHMQ